MALNMYRNGNRHHCHNYQSGCVLSGDHYNGYSNYNGRNYGNHYQNGFNYQNNYQNAYYDRNGYNNYPVSYYNGASYSMQVPFLHNSGPLLPCQQFGFMTQQRSEFITSGTRQVTRYTYQDGRTNYEYYSQSVNGQVVVQQMSAYQRTVTYGGLSAQQAGPQNYPYAGSLNAIKYNQRQNPRFYNRGSRNNYKQNRNFKHRSFFRGRESKEPRAWNYHAYMENKRRNNLLKKFVCSTCSEEFRNENSLKSHEQIMHPVATEKDNFIDTAAFTAGLFQHSTPLKIENTTIHCEYCPKKFTTKYALQRHMDKIHTSLSDKSFRSIPISHKIKAEKLSFKKERLSIIEENK